MPLSPPAPLVLDHNDTSTMRPQLDADPFPPLVARDRQLSRPIPIEGVTPLTPAQPYPLGSQESTMSDISASTGASVPPLTSMSTLGIPTPYTIRTPASTTASSSTIRPITAIPFSPSPTTPDEALSPPSEGLVRVKSFPHNGDLLGGPVEAASARSFSNGSASQGPQRERGVNQMEIDGDVDVREPERRSGGQEEYRDMGSPIYSDPSSSGQESLTHLIRDIGSPSTSHRTAYPQSTPPVGGPSAFRRGWDQAGSPSVHPASDPTFDPWNQPSSSTDLPPRSPVTPGLNMLGPLPCPTRSAVQSHPSRDGVPGYLDRPQSSMLASRSARSSFTAPRSGSWTGVLEDNTIGMVPPHLSRNMSSSVAHTSRTESSQINPTRSGDTSLPFTFHTLPSPISNIPSSGSPGALERRIDNIEARLGRVRNRGIASPSTPPPLIAGHSYQGITSRSSSSSRPHELPSRSRYSPPSALVSNTYDRASPGSSRSAPLIRPSWLNPASSLTSTATVPPPRGSPSHMFPWTPEDSVHDDGYRGTWGPRSNDTGRSQDEYWARLGNQSAPSPAFSHEPGLDAMRSSQPVDQLDSRRAGLVRPAATRPASNIHDRPADHLGSHSLQRDDRASYEDSFRHAFGVGMGNRSIRDPTLRTPTGQFGLGWEFDGPMSGLNEANNSAPIRPSNRRWMSFDEGERESSRERERARGEEATTFGALNRDVNEVVGRRLSQVRPRSSSVTRRLRDHLGPDWEDTHVGGSTSSVSSSIEQDDRPARRQRLDDGDRDRELWGEMPVESFTRPEASDLFGFRSARDPLDLFSSGRDRSATSSPADELAAFIERRSRSRYAAGPTSNADTGGVNDPAIVLLDRLQSRDPFLSRGFRPDLAEGLMDLNDVPVAFAYLNSIRRMHMHTPLTSVKITVEMSDDEKSKVVQMVIKGMARLPPGPRKQAAESVLEIVPWGQFGERADMSKDEYCSVCHDEYEDETKLAVTPCKHMYHKDCLETWLNTPNTSSCPMCRRDLAALACLGKMVPTKKIDEAMPLWMNAAL